MTRLPGSVRAGCAPLDSQAILAALPWPLMLLDPGNGFRFVNPAAEQFLGLSRSQLAQMSITDVVAAGHPLIGIIDQARAGAITVADHDVALEGPRLRRAGLVASATHVPEQPGCVLLSLQDGQAARVLDRHAAFRGAARSVTGMAAMLAHEIRNPLSGIRGAAQLLEASVDEADRELPVLIRQEADRIHALVDRVAAFGDQPVDHGGVNIHRVLSHVRRLAEHGFAAGLPIREAYDPSLPPVQGNRDQLVQVVLNLVKNAAEAVGRQPDGEIMLSTGYQHGLRLAAGPGERPGQGVHLPLVVTVRDNGPGIPADIRPHLFEPFVTSKTGGRGLGLALVAKIMGDHGGLVEVDSDAGRTEFRLRLPMAPENGA